MFDISLQQFVKNSYYSEYIPTFIQIPVEGSSIEVTTKAIHEATLDDLEFALIALEEEQHALHCRASAIRELYKQARKNRALGAENIVDALTRSNENEGGIQ